MDRLIKLSDAIDAFNECLETSECGTSLNEETYLEKLNAIPSIDISQRAWVDKAISVINEMQQDGIVDYEQAVEFRMRARIKGESDE